MKSFIAAMVMTGLAFVGGAMWQQSRADVVEAEVVHTWIFHHAADQTDALEFMNSLTPDQRANAKITPFSTAGYTIWVESN